MEQELTPLTGKIKQSKYLVLDIESKDGDSQEAGFTRPFMCGVFDGEKYYAFYDQDEYADPRERYWMPGGCVDRMMRFILRRKYRHYHIYAHNAALPPTVKTFIVVAVTEVPPETVKTSLAG